MDRNAFSAVLSARLREMRGFRVEPIGVGNPFIQVGRYDVQLPAQGWKLHVSTDVRNAPALVSQVLPVLTRHRVHFKIASSLSDVAAINSGERGISQVGKVLTVYPENTGIGLQTAHELDGIWRPSRFPRVPSDVEFRPGSAVFCRYGAFLAPDQGHEHERSDRSEVVTPEGLRVPDIRSLVGRQPDWCQRFGECLSAPDRFPEHLVIGGRSFKLVHRLRYAARGAVFLALSEHLESAVIRIAFPGTAEDQRGFDTADRLPGELRILDAARRADVNCPRLLAYEGAPLHMVAFLGIDGENLDSCPKPKALAGLQEAAAQVGRLHKAGFVHRDLKPSNILVGDGVVSLLDFELAAAIGSTAPIGGSTLFLSPEANMGPACTGQDVYALGVTAGVVAARAADGPVAKSLADIREVLSLRGDHRMLALFDRSTAPDIKSRCCLYELMDRLGAIS